MTACWACRTSTTCSTQRATWARRSSSSGGGIIQTRAQQVLADAHELLERIAETGLFTAIADASFGDVSRRVDEGRGLEGIVKTGEGYLNPAVELMGQASYA